MDSPNGKGLPGRSEIMPGRNSFKNPIGASLTRGKKVEIIELERPCQSRNYFGRMKMLRGLFGKIFRFGEVIYDTLMRVCASLTNHHILINPLRDGDLLINQQQRRNMYKYGTLGALKRKNDQERYRIRHSCRIRLSERQEDSLFDHENITVGQEP